MTNVIQFPLEAMELLLTEDELLIVEARAAAAGLSFEDFVRREVLRPWTEEELAGVAPKEN